MFEFYDNFTFLGKLIFLFGLLVVLCSIFYQCTYCKYIPVKLQWDNSAYKSNLAQQVPIEPFEEMPIQSRLARLQRLKSKPSYGSQKSRMALSDRFKSQSKQLSKFKSMGFQNFSKKKSLGNNSRRSSRNTREQKQKKAKLIMFYADWCRHCKNFKPEWKKLVSKLKGLVETVSVNGDTEPQMMSEYNIDKFPTIVYDDGTNAVEYDGEMTADGLKQFVVTNYNNGSTTENLVY